jgi:tetratricopeptide (TPR) repeat protein
LRAIAATYCFFILDEDGNLDRIDLPFVVEQLNQCVRLSTTSRDNIITLYFLGRVYCLPQKYTDAITAYRKVLEQIPKAESAQTGTADLEMIAIRDQTTQQIVPLYTSAAQYQQAVDLLIDLKQFSKSTEYGEDPDIIEYCSKLDPSGQNAMGMLKAWSRKERKSYMRFVYGSYWYWVATKQQVIEHTRPARRTGEMALYMRWMTEGKTNPYQQHAIAFIYEIVLHDEVGAEEARNKIFKMRPAAYDADMSAFEIQTVQEESWRKQAAALYRRFQATSDLKARENLLEKLESLPVLSFQQSEELQESQVGMLRAYMLRILG